MNYSFPISDYSREIAIGGVVSSGDDDDPMAESKIQEPRMAGGIFYPSSDQILDPSAHVP